MKRKDVTDEAIKGKKPIVKLKIVVGMALAKKIKKTWMIHLPQYCPYGLWGYYAGFGAAFFMWKIAHIAFYADLTVKLWINFPAVGTANDERHRHDTQKNTQT